MGSVYKVIELIGSSDTSWEEAVKIAINTASKSLQEIRVAEVKELDVAVEEGKLQFRAKIRLSFKYND